MLAYGSVDPSTRVALEAFLVAAAYPGLENHLTEAKEVRGDLNALVIGDEFESLLERQDAGWGQTDGVVGSGSAHVGLFLLTADVDVHIVEPRVLADNHALVDLVAGSDEQRSPVLQGGNGVSGDRAPAIGDDRA